MKAFTAAVLVLAPWALAGCEKARNYPDPHGPRYAGGIASPDPDPIVKVVTFNIRYAREIDRALEVFSKDLFKGADVIALQEMDAPGAERMAGALGCAYVYYPAAFRPGGGKDFGNAVLSRWPILDDHKVVLPHLSPFRNLQRAATAATVSVNGVATRVYSVHLEAPPALTHGQRRDQARTVVEERPAFPGPRHRGGGLQQPGRGGRGIRTGGLRVDHPGPGVYHLPLRLGPRLRAGAAGQHAGERRRRPHQQRRPQPPTGMGRPSGARTRPPAAEYPAS